MSDEPVILTAAMARELARMHLIRPDNAHKPLEAIATGRTVVVPAWQPIATAPKDGTEILIAWSERHQWRYTIGHWSTHNGEYEKDTHKHWKLGRMSDPSVTAFSPEEFNRCFRWMPIPPIGAFAGEAGGGT